MMRLRWLVVTAKQVVLKARLNPRAMSRSQAHQVSRRIRCWLCCGVHISGKSSLGQSPQPCAQPLDADHVSCSRTLSPLARPSRHADMCLPAVMMAGGALTWRAN
jgi:hypothetical protein